jgi:fructose-1,6-bisphosphatase/inositol monophosphatase family enzyme
MRSALLDEVGDVMRTVASEVIVPRFRALAEGDVEEKAPGELVTVADREAEELLTEALLELLPGARVVGEERTSQDPTQLEQLDQGDVWLLDPIDGTANFIHGRPCFAVMVALLSQGETVAAWLLDPITDALARAERGAGAFVDGQRLQTQHGSPGEAQLRGAVLKKYMPFALRQQVEQRIPRVQAALPGLRCAGAEYPAIARSEQDFAVFWRTLPWDHAPGALFLTEAGGMVARFDGSPYQPADDKTGLVIARNPDVWRDAVLALLR